MSALHVLLSDREFRLRRDKNFIYTASRAAVVVEAQPSDSYLAETATMIVTGIILSVLGIALLCRLLFTLAVQALPLFIGALVGAQLSQNGASAILAIATGLVAAASAFGIARFLYATTRSRLVRVAIALVLTGPAAFAGYHASLGIARIAAPSEAWHQALALLGAFVIGCVATVRLNAAMCR